MSSNKLYKLLNIDIFENQLDGDAIIEEVRRNPQSAASKYTFTDYSEKMCGLRKTVYTCYPLYHAINLWANIDVVKAIYDSYPPAIEEKYVCGPRTIDCSALHLACRKDAPAKVICFVASKFPAAARMKNQGGHVPLHYACGSGAPVDVVSCLLKIWPDAVVVKNCDGISPIHLAYWKASIETVSVLLEYSPQAARLKDNRGKTTLHWACNSEYVYLQEMLFLLEKWPEAVKERDFFEQTPLHVYEATSRHNTEDDEVVKNTLALVYRLFDDDDPMDDDSCQEIMNYFTGIEWWNGVLLILDRYTRLKKLVDIDTNVFPNFLSAVGRHCKMKTMWQVISNELDIMEGVH